MEENMKAYIQDKLTDIKHYIWKKRKWLILVAVISFFQPELGLLIVGLFVAYKAITLGPKYISKKFRQFCIWMEN